MQNFKKRFHKIFLWILALVSVISSSGTSVWAEEIGRNYNGNYSYYGYNEGMFTAVGNYNWTVFTTGMFDVNGKPAYCIEPLVYVEDQKDVYQSATWADYSAYSAATKKAITEYAYFGYGYNGRYDYKYYVATQMLIWTAINSKYADTEWYGHSGTANTIDISTCNDENATIRNASKEIQRDIDRYHTAVNFSVKDSSGKTLGSGNSVSVQAVMGDTLTITDTSGVLSNYYIESNGFGNDLSRSGNTITIKLNSVGNKTVTFNHNSASDDIDGTFILVSKDSTPRQAVVVRGRTEPMRAELKINVIGAPYDVKKVDSNGSYVSGAELELRDSSGKVMEKWTSATDIHKTQVLIPGTKYSVVETKVPEGYVLAKPYNFTADAKNTSIAIKNYRVSVEKKDDAGTVLSNAKLQVVDSSGTVMDSWTTDGSVHYVKNLKEGQTYTLQETEAPSFGYELAKDKTFTPDGGDIALTAVDQRKTIYVTAYKYDAYDPTTPLAGAEFTVFNKNDDSIAKTTLGTDAVVVTDENGTAHFELYYSPDNYYMMETKAPEGYLNDHENEKMDITPSAAYTFKPDDPIFVFTLTDRANTKLSMIKQDSETGNTPQGESTFDGAVFEVFDTKLQKTLDTKLVTDQNGVSNVIEHLPFDRIYEIKEVTAPEGYKINKTAYQADIKTAGLVDNGYVFVLTAKDDVITGNFTIRKLKTSRTESEFADPEEGAEFAVVLKKYVDQYGSVAKAIEHKEDYFDREWDILTTGKDGNAKSKDLAYGHYVIAQTKGEKEYEIVNDTAEFIVDTEDQETKQYSASNIPETYYIRMLKLDKDTGKTVIFHSATFKLQDENGKDVDMRVGSKHYTSFKTTSIDSGKTKKGTFYNEDEEKGTAYTPLVLESGTYTLTEIETPWGFVTLEKPISITVKESRIAEVDGDGKNVIKVEISNNRAYGELVIHKTVEEFESDKTFIDRKDLSTVEFTLTAKEDVLNPDDGSVLYKAGDVYGVYNLSKDGSLDVKDIPLGKYELQETKVPDGMVLDKTVHQIVFEQKDPTTKVYKQEVSVENKTTKIALSKKAATGEDELPGATIVITDKEGNEVDTWVSGDHAHVIEGLKIGEIYTMTETITPKDENGEDLGYAKASSIAFTVKEDGSIDTVTMIDKIVTMTKQDMNGKEVPGASMTVTDKETGAVVDQWTSSDKPHNIKNLEVGRTYILHEDTAPAGYAKATDIEFTVENDGKDQTVVMIDKIVTLTKEDGGNSKEVPGAHIQVLDEEGNVVDEWTSTEEPHQIENLEVGKTYTMHEEQTPDGYYYAVDGKFTVTDDGVDQAEKMIDNPIIYEILKVDDKTGEPVEGVELKLIDTTTGEEVKGSPWTTTKEPIVLDRVLIAGHDYELIESEWVAGVHKSTSITFSVGLTGTADKKTITMVDLVNAISFLKVNPEGKPLAGAKMMILESMLDDKGNYVPKTDEKGNYSVITTFTTTEDPAGVSVDDNGVEIASLLKGDVLKEEKNEENQVETAEDPDHLAETAKDPVYILMEFSAPFGYEVAENIVFTVRGTLDRPQMIMMTDERKTFYVSVDKVDADDASKKLYGAEITVFKEKDDSIAKTVDGKDAVAVTGKDGNVVFELPYSEEGYYVGETKAPEGYKINKNRFKVELSDDYDFAKEHPIVIRITDKEKPVNTAFTGPVGYAALTGTAVLLLYLILKKKKNTGRPV